ncbi:hypothetical protein SAMD00019534_120220 [Acytostelium subglobosum LB1]|uniref:hypothetical protein n=1 Tax=Acytostelium subglobosum LB1 TaxID=1410327 RepID=UPI0006450AFB|nr:hypothetical protein SAMD00019534_120220 [Acytostelium subglobosum LB1]GAM28846.1 hypothetical protein SAMD00019534_120220 [Acytostelium subglobosum LB1]|eukprot:XP_012748218.1 hypothetical protein SAMD00019534_120220 [Acytostelium subglobosum LB1]
MESLYYTNNSPSFISVPVDEFKCLKLQTSDNGIAELIMTSKNKLNLMTDQFFNEFIAAFDKIQNDKSIRVVIIWSDGKLFSAGLDLVTASSSMSTDDTQSFADQGVAIFKLVRRWQASFDKINKCSKPVIAAVHGHCIGGAVDLITACDIRLCTSDAAFSIKETKLAIVADLGTLQRIQRVCGTGFAREMAFTGEPANASTAEKFGLVNKVLKDKDELLAEARSMAAKIAANSPMVVQSTKLIMNHAQDHTIDEGLLRVALHNSIFLKNDDLVEAVGAFTEKRAPIFKSSL